LPLQIQRVHDNRARKVLRGRCLVERGRHSFVRILAPIASLPSSADDVPISVEISMGMGDETWARNFDGHVMRSRLWAQDDLLAERLGAVTLLFKLRAIGGRIVWQVVGARFLGVPLPTSWFAGAGATEEVIDGRYTFDVRATLPLVGLLVHYRGWLSEDE
jgi:hypothetical protein